jgi:hypothetical protein
MGRRVRSATRSAHRPHRVRARSRRSRFRALRSRDSCAVDRIGHGSRCYRHRPTNGTTSKDDRVPFEGCRPWWEMWQAAGRHLRFCLAGGGPLRWALSYWRAASRGCAFASWWCRASVRASLSPTCGPQLFQLVDELIAPCIAVHASPPGRPGHDSRASESPPRGEPFRMPAQRCVLSRRTRPLRRGASNLTERYRRARSP